MPHRSRLCAIMIDCPPDGMDAGVDFWAKALNSTCRLSAAPRVSLAHTSLLKVGPEDSSSICSELKTDARTHLDFETDDVEAAIYLILVAAVAGCIGLLSRSMTIAARLPRLGLSKLVYGINRSWRSTGTSVWRSEEVTRMRL